MNFFAFFLGASIGLLSWSFLTRFSYAVHDVTHKITLASKLSAQTQCPKWSSTFQKNVVVGYGGSHRLARGFRGNLLAFCALGFVPTVPCVALWGRDNNSKFHRIHHH